MKFKESKIKIIYSNKLRKITQYLFMRLWLKKIIFKPFVDSWSLRKNLNEWIFTQFIVKEQEMKAEEY